MEGLLGLTVGGSVLGAAVTSAGLSGIVEFGRQAFDPCGFDVGNILKEGVVGGLSGGLANKIGFDTARSLALGSQVPVKTAVKVGETIETGLGTIGGGF